MLYIFAGYFIPCSFEVHWQLTSSKVVFSYIIWINGHTFNIIITGLIIQFVFIDSFAQSKLWGE